MGRCGSIASALESVDIRAKKLPRNSGPPDMSHWGRCPQNCKWMEISRFADLLYAELKSRFGNFPVCCECCNYGLFDDESSNPRGATCIEQYEDLLAHDKLCHPGKFSSYSKAARAGSCAWIPCITQRGIGAFWQHLLDVSLGLLSTSEASAKCHVQCGL